MYIGLISRLYFVSAAAIVYVKNEVTGTANSVTALTKNVATPLHWHDNDHDGVSNHQPHGCLLNRLSRRRSKKTSKIRVTGLCVGNSPGPVNSPHKGPVTRKIFPFDDVIMQKAAFKRVGIGQQSFRNLGIGTQTESYFVVYGCFAMKIWRCWHEG